MESGDTFTINTESPSRRVTRQSTKELVLKPREPLRRRRRDAVDLGGTVVNGSESRKRLPSTDDEEEPLKKRRSTQSTEDEGADDDEMELQVDGDDAESDENKDMCSEKEDLSKLQFTKVIKESSVRLIPLKNFPSSTERVVHLDPQESGLRSRRSIHQTRTNSGIDTEAIKHGTEPCAPLHIPIRPVLQPDPRNERQTMQNSIKQYHDKMQEGLPDLTKTSRRGLAHNQTSNNIPHKKEQSRKAGALPKPKTGASPKAKTRTPSDDGVNRVYSLILWLFLLCVIFSLGVLSYQRFPWSSLQRRAVSRPTQEAPLDIFSARLTVLEQQFHNQQKELWRRSRIHLQRHLEVAQPSEPVSLILTGGQGAERTLGCLAASLASAFSSAVNGSVLQLDGTNLADKDSHQVKLDLDNQLKEAFEGDKPAAVIHRLEELPPSSTLIFYRYCDHENAAYKHPLLAFTVLLPQDAVGPEVSLQEVEEMVHTHIHKKFLMSDQPDSFDKMDNDKLSGLWSRISHLILPVNKEENIEKGGCDAN